YAGTRAEVERLAGDLEGALGVEVVPYHAGLGREERAEAQRRFMSGEVPIVVATNAFGMGVDKADVRTVAHATVPGSVEAFYQEAGRGGRDGAPARCLLFAEKRDKGLHVLFIERDAVDEGLFARLAAALELHAREGGGYDLEAGELAGIAGCDSEQLRALVGHLARAGVLQPAPASPDRVRGRLLGPLDGAALSHCRTSASEAQRARWRQYRAVWSFVEQEACRREAILRHFGDRGAPVADGPCCDVCDPALAEALSPPPAPALAGAVGEDLDTAIVEVVTRARPSVGRTRAVEILRGGRSRVIREHSY